MDNLLSQINEQLKNNRPFVIYASPNTSLVQGIFQVNNENYQSAEEHAPCFIVQPFNEERKGFVIPLNQSKLLEFDFQPKQVSDATIKVKPSKKEEQHYENLVSKALDWIVNRKMLKIVTSRKYETVLKEWSFEELFQRLFSLYPSAFRYIWFHPESGVWCGASPELLLQSEGECFKTMALAGTQIPDGLGRVLWSDKEKEEQQLVVDDITNKLQSVLSVLKISKTHNHHAGSVVHLKTDISGCVKKGKASLFGIAQSLHPTPAVCGTPRTKAQLFIHNHEGYDRELYTGYLGFMGGKEKDSSLYVNLRCMKLEKDRAFIYVGGGITQGSIPFEEWKETENKLQTMLKVLQPFL